MQKVFTYGYQVSAGYSQDIKLVSINKCTMYCGVYMVDNNINYSLVKRGITMGFMGTIRIMDEIGYKMIF